MACTRQEYNLLDLHGHKQNWFFFFLWGLRLIDFLMGDRAHKYVI